MGSALDAAADADGASLSADEALPASETVTPVLLFLIAAVDALPTREALAPPETERAEEGEGDASVEGVGKEGAALPEGDALGTREGDVMGVVEDSCVPTSDTAPVWERAGEPVAQLEDEGEKGALLPTAEMEKEEVAVDDAGVEGVVVTVGEREAQVVGDCVAMGESEVRAEPGGEREARALPDGDLERGPVAEMERDGLALTEGPRLPEVRADALAARELDTVTVTFAVAVPESVADAVKLVTTLTSRT